MLYHCRGATIAFGVPCPGRFPFKDSAVPVDGGSGLAFQMLSLSTLFKLYKHHKPQRLKLKPSCRRSRRRSRPVAEGTARWEQGPAWPAKALGSVGQCRACKVYRRHFGVYGREFNKKSDQTRNLEPRHPERKSPNSAD